MCVFVCWLKSQIKDLLTIFHLRFGQTLYSSLGPLHDHLKKGLSRRQWHNFRTYLFTYCTVLCTHVQDLQYTEVSTQRVDLKTATNSSDSIEHTLLEKCTRLPTSMNACHVSGWIQTPRFEMQHQSPSVLSVMKLGITQFPVHQRICLR